MIFNMFVWENLSLDIYGSVAMQDAQLHLPDKFHSLLEGKERVRVKLQFAQIDHFVVKQAPFGFSRFSKALWYIELPHKKTNQWYLLRCDINHDLMRKIGGSAFGFAIQAAEFSFFEKRKSVISNYSIPSLGDLKCHVDLMNSLDSLSTSDTIHITKGGLQYSFDKEEVSAPFSRLALVDIVRDDLSHQFFVNGVNWDSKGLVTRGRVARWKKNDLVL